LIGYLGTKYGGFQINERVRSVQSEIELALYRHQYISASNFGCPQKYHWSTSGRTDKGVHAAAQVASFKMELLPHELTGNPADHTTSTDALVHRINASLPNDIRILDVGRTVKNFAAKIQRDYVQYRYLIPSIYFYPREELNTIFQTTIVSSPVVHTTTMEANVGTNHPATNMNEDSTNSANADLHAVSPPTTTGSTDPPPPPFWYIKPDEVRQIYDVVSEYRSTVEQRQLLQSTMQQYIGTHSFHNFTRRCTSQEARSVRYIMDFIVEDPIVMETTIPSGDGSDGGINNHTYRMEWIPVNIIGQSFLLNQIRKMIWLAIEIARGAMPATSLKEALQRNIVSKDITTTNSNTNNNNAAPVRIGMAPAQGLFLDMSYYKNYNEKVLRTKNSGQTNNDAVGLLDWHLEHTVANQRWKEFRNTVITQHIAQEEIQYGNFLQHIYMEEHRSYFYTDFTKDENDGNDNDDDDDDDENGGMEDE
jgi:tRNA pseudouridine38-40 synthase